MKSLIHKEKQIVSKFPCYMIYEKDGIEFIILATEKNNIHLVGIVVASDGKYWPVGYQSLTFIANAFEPFVGSFTVECP